MMLGKDEAKEGRKARGKEYVERERTKETEMKNEKTKRRWT